MSTRRKFIQSSAAAIAGAAFVSKAGAATLPEAPEEKSADTRPPPEPSSGRPFHPVVTLNGWSLPWRTNGKWKEFHLTAEPVERELTPGSVANLWG